MLIEHQVIITTIIRATQKNAQNEFKKRHTCAEYMHATVSVYGKKTEQTHKEIKTMFLQIVRYQRKKRTGLSSTGKKEDSMEDYCNKGEELLQQRGKTELNSTETEGRRRFKCLGELLRKSWRIQWEGRRIFGFWFLVVFVSYSHYYYLTLISGSGGGGCYV